MNSRLHLAFLIAFQAAAIGQTIEIVNPDLEINNGVDGTALSEGSVLGWDGSGGRIASGRTDYGNGRWRIEMDDGEQVFQITPHVISPGEAFSLRFDAAPFAGSAGSGAEFVSDLQLVGPSLRNGDFNEDTDPSDSRTFDQTPWWSNLGTAGNGSQATRTTLPVDGTRNAVLSRNGTRVFAVDTEHTLTEGEVFRVRYQWRDASAWVDASDRVRATIFTTDNNLLSGERNVLESLDSELSASDSAYETQISTFAPIPPGRAGKRLFLSIGSNVGSGDVGFARLDNVILERGVIIPATTPGAVIADLYVEGAGGREVVASKVWEFSEQALGEWRHHHLAAEAGSLDSFAGMRIGIQFRGIESAATRLHSIDHIHLDAFPGAPVHGFVSDWDSTPDQVWPGPGYWGNRLHDWRVSDHRLECILGDRDRRTVHRTQTSIAGNGEGFELSVRLGLRSGSSSVGSRAGFLIGSGPSLDWRAAMLVHDGLGRDFGLFCGISGDGRALIEDYSTGTMRVLDAGPAIAGGLGTDLRITLKAEAAGQDYLLSLNAFVGAEELPRSTATTIVSSDRVLGSFGLLSHRGGGSATHWFDDFSGTGAALIDHPDRSLGIVGAMHTLSHGQLTLCAQLMPLDRTVTQSLLLETFNGQTWVPVASAPIDPEPISAYNAVFRIPDWPTDQDVPYRIGVSIGGETFFHTGTIRREPVDRESLTVASITCQRVIDGNLQADGFDWTPVRVWHPHTQPVRHIEKHAPDLIAATGDQIYEGQPTPEDSGNDFARHHDYLYKWYLFALQFRDLARDIPMFCMPDDHDVFQGNLWGEGGVLARVQNEGGYEEPANWVRMLERSQYSSLPPGDPYNDVQPAPRISPDNAGGLDVYFTGISYAGLGIAVIEDRKFKSGPTAPPADNQLTLLGDRQHAFLEAWARDWTGDQKVKFVISQSPFGNLHTHANTGYGRGLNDRDTHGWPPERRKDAWRLLRKSFMFQLAGDQHLSTLVRHGIETSRDAGYSFTSPAIANFFPRCFDPDHLSAGRTSVLRPFVGDYFFDGSDGRPASDFPHHLQMIAAANPLEYYNQTNGINPENLHDRGAGYGLVKINKSTRAITFESWPRYADPDYPETGSQYPGWPVTINQADNEGRRPAGFLPTVTSPTPDPVVWVVDESSGELIYGLRIRGQSFKPPIFDLSRSYRIEMREGDHEQPDLVLSGLTAVTADHQIETFTSSARQIPAGSSLSLRWQTCSSAALTLSPGGIDLMTYSAFGAGVLELSPAEDTTYTLTSTDAGGAVLSEEIHVRVFPNQQSWIESHFSATELGDPSLEESLWGEDADPDQDGLDNCLEYLLQGDPRARSPELLPVSTMERSGDQVYAIHRYTEPIEDGRAQVIAENSGSLLRWTIADAPDIEEIERISQPGQVDRVVLRQSPPAGEGDSLRMFYRLQIKKRPR